MKRKGIEKLHETALYKAVLELKTLEECKCFFADLCTPSEIADFCDRWQAAQMLIEDTPYREIALKTGISTTTIGRVARFLHDGNGGYKTVLERQGKL